MPKGVGYPKKGKLASKLATLFSKRKKKK